LSILKKYIKKYHLQNSIAFEESLKSYINRTYKQMIFFEYIEKLIKKNIPFEKFNFDDFQSPITEKQNQITSL
jgi:hypothetical protein